MSMASNLDRKWRAYSTDFQQFAPAYIREQVSHMKSPFVCPLCLCAFAHQHDHDNPVSVEHIIPSAIGGKLTTLTCRRCNNKDGSMVESHLVKQVQLETGKRQAIASLDFKETTLRGELRLAGPDDNVLEYRIVRKMSDTRREEEVRQYLAEGQRHAREINLKVDFDYRPALAHVALLRSAYLFVFWRLGYGYVFDSSASAIREQLNEPTRRTPALHGICKHEIVDLPAEILFAAVIGPPDVHSSLAVFLRTDEGSGAFRQVLLPPLNTDGMAFYRRLQQYNHPRTLTYKVDEESLTYQLN